MYANTPELQSAWQCWFEAFSQLYSDPSYSEINFYFDTSDQAYLAPNLIAVQTCGYPLLHKWATTHDPIAAAVFDCKGCVGTQYSSWFVTHVNHPADRLEQFQHQRAAMSGIHSNSGMNVLRFAISQLPKKKRVDGTFFSEVKVSGGHWQSLEMIASEQADLAAIDAVSYALALKAKPALADSIKIVGQSEMTVGLPFVIPKTSTTRVNRLIRAMDQATIEMDQSARDTLSLRGFSRVKLRDYKKIEDLEKSAIRAKYSKLK